MPRLPPKLLIQARNVDPLLPILLPACRELQSARHELRWLREHAIDSATKRHRASKSLGWRSILRKYCLERGRGRPLQYILGTEFFGDLEIVCRPGVLIPRGDTASIVTYLAELLRKQHGSAIGSAVLESLRHGAAGDTAGPKLRPLRVLDVCTGTGCMALLFHHLIKSLYDVESLAIDVSPSAVALARLNASRLLPVQSLSKFNVARADVLKEETLFAGSTAGEAPSISQVLEDRGSDEFEILLSNPPYISPHDFWHTTARSVRNFEPKLALVPPQEHVKTKDVRRAMGDDFYPRLLEVAELVRAKIVLFEVADVAQAVRVAACARAMGEWSTIEIWKDEPGANEIDYVDNFMVRGCGNGRGVYLCR